MEEKGGGPFDQEVVRYQKAKAEGKKTVLFLCTANAVRSQMAEALVNHYLNDQWAAFSAGYLPMDVHPLVIKVMNEIGADLSLQKAKHINSFLDLRFDKIITLCTAADTVCASYPGLGPKDHIPFEDPALSYSSIFGGKGLFRDLREKMKTTLIPYLEGATDGKIS